MKDTLLEKLFSHAERFPEKIAYRFLVNGDCGADSKIEELSYQKLALSVIFKAQAMKNLSGPIILLFEPGLEYLTTLLGCFYAGKLAVPLYPLALGQKEDRVIKVIADTQARYAVTSEKFYAVYDPKVFSFTEKLKVVVLPQPNLQNLKSLKVDSNIKKDDLAFLQYTSGSTSDPKGVMISHHNLMINECMISELFKQDDESVVISWLPLYHDMGLIGNMFQPLYVGGTCVFMSPMSFLKKPVRWLKAISHFHGTTSGGPNFSFDACTDRIRYDQLEGLDLRSWRVAYNGSEPVRKSTLLRFEKRFREFGFKFSSFYPCYGLAEATLLVSTEGMSEATYDDLKKSPEKKVNSGKPAVGLDVLIVDPETNSVLSQSNEGEIWAKGENIAQGYWQNAAKTSETFHAFTQDGRGPFLKTGDLGLFEEDRLVITGRLKDLIIWEGRNIYPQDIEYLVADLDKVFRPYCSAIFSVEKEESEKLVFLQELDSKELKSRSKVDLEKWIRSEVSSEFQCQLETIVFLESGQIPKTSSGKVMRRASQEMWLEHTLKNYSFSVEQELR